MWKLKKETEEDYFSSYGLNVKEPKKSIVTASILKDIFNRRLLDVLLRPLEHDKNTLQNFKTGSALHKYILEGSTFENEYHFGDFNPAKKTTELNKKDEDLLKTIKKECEIKYPELLDEKGAEVTISGDYLGVNVKAKMDKMVMSSSNRVYLYDLKSTSLPMNKVKRTTDGRAWEVARQVNDYHYDLQMYFYSLLIEEWARKELNKYVEVSPILVFASKIDFGVRQFMLSPETIEQGKTKFEVTFNQVLEFVNGGLKYVNKFEVL
jgi:hypothetical protein